MAQPVLSTKNGGFIPLQQSALRPAILAASFPLGLVLAMTSGGMAIPSLIRFIVGVALAMTSALYAVGLFVSGAQTTSLRSWLEGYCRGFAIITLLITTGVSAAFAVNDPSANGWTGAVTGIVCLSIFGVMAWRALRNK